jgi:hypothetical protein
MSESTSYTPFYFDSRGNRLERWEVASTGSGHVLRLRGPIEVVEQVQAVASEYKSGGYRASTVSEWTHELSSPDPTMKREVRQLLELLERVLSLPSSLPIKFAIALGLVQDPRRWRGLP